MNSGREYTSQERAMLVAWALCEGTKLTVKDVVYLTGLKPRSAKILLGKAERVLPIMKGVEGVNGLKDDQCWGKIPH